MNDEKIPDQPDDAAQDNARDPDAPLTPPVKRKSTKAMDKIRQQIDAGGSFADAEDGGRLAGRKKPRSRR